METGNQRITVYTPLTDKCISELNTGQLLYITGTIYTARDAAHKRLVEMLCNGEKMPFNFNGQIVYYAGPCPNRPEHIIGSIGPTTSCRMDKYSKILIEKGLKAMIGKGVRDKHITEAIKKHNGIYFTAIGGAAALMAQCVKKVETIAFEDLGTEAIRKLEVENLPVIVAIDTK